MNLVALNGNEAASLGIILPKMLPAELLSSLERLHSLFWVD